jgi:hypothetical protein
MMDITVGKSGAWIARFVFAGAVACSSNCVQAQAGYPSPAPLDQYHVAIKADEIAFARSAAPASISSHAEVLTLGSRSYEIAVKGENGFVCLVLRGWSGDFADPDFWNPKVLAPICYNRIAARSVMPNDLRRARWVLAGVSKADMVNRTKAAIASHEIVPPGPGAMSYMMSRNGYLSDRDGHWRPHLMLFLPRMSPGEWGANLPDSVLMGDAASLEPLTVFFIPLARWSDGTPAPAPAPAPMRM